jgi:hypothetical protein
MVSILIKPWQTLGHLIISHLFRKKQTNYSLNWGYLTMTEGGEIRLCGRVIHLLEEYLE